MSILVTFPIVCPTKQKLYMINTAGLRKGVSTAPFMWMVGETLFCVCPEMIVIDAACQLRPGYSFTSVKNFSCWHIIFEVFKISRLLLNLS